MPNPKNSFKLKKKFFKERQILYEKMRSLKNYGDIVQIDDDVFMKVCPDEATHIFIWFKHKPRICEYYAPHKAYYIGSKTFHISNPSKKTNKVINFTKKYEQL